jgi:hypothetical protein
MIGCETVFAYMHRFLIDTPLLISSGLLGHNSLVSTRQISDKQGLNLVVMKAASEYYAELRVDCGKDLHPAPSSP